MRDTFFFYFGLTLMKTTFMKKLLFLAISGLLFFGCNKEQPTSNTSLNGDVLRAKKQTVAIPDGDAFSKSTVDEFVLATMEREKDFRWTMADWKMQWSAIQYGNQTVAIGYRSLDVENVDEVIHRINLSTGNWKATHDALKQFILDALKEVRGYEVKWSDIVVEDDPVLPIFTLRLPDKEVLTALLNLENVRYIEPMDYWPGEEAERSTSGCSSSTLAVQSADVTSSAPGCFVPWNFTSVGIPQAWNTAQGQGITVGIIDAGLSSSQSLLGSQFNNGSSNVGRTVTTSFTWGNSAFSTCSHGTAMSGLAVGPRNSLGASTGVAYRSNLHFIRGCQDVVLDLSSERTGVKNALVQMGNNSAVKIVSLSVGTPFYSSVLLDGVNYANNNGKLIFAAAGTSSSWVSWWGVVYPAAFSQCLAITGVNESGSTCESCHDGAEVDFTIPMERNSNENRNGISLPQSGTALTYIGGSSCATATAAGIAALVWSVKPSLTKQQVVDCLTTTSQLFPSFSSWKGYGNLNAQAAVAAAQSQVN
jgi:serine protease